MKAAEVSTRKAFASRPGAAADQSSDDTHHCAGRATPEVRSANGGATNKSWQVCSLRVAST